MKNTAFQWIDKKKKSFKRSNPLELLLIKANAQNLSFLRLKYLIYKCVMLQINPAKYCDNL